MLGALAFGFALLLSYFAWRRVSRFRGLFESNGVPVAPGYPWKLHAHNIIYNDLRCQEKYGRVWGRYFFFGHEACLTVSEPDLLKEMFVAKNDHFYDRMILDDDLDDRYRTIVESGRDYHRPLRKALTPIFTTGKIRGMIDPIGGVADSAVEHISKKMGNGGRQAVVEVKELFQTLALDMVARCAFGAEVNAMEDPSNELYKTCVKAAPGLSLPSWTASLLFHVFSAVPQVTRLINMIDTKSYNVLWSTTKEIALQRKESKTYDFIDALNELRKSSDLESKLSEDVIFAQGITFFQGGFETTSNALTTFTYNMAKHPDVQERIAIEVRELLERSDSCLDYDNVKDLVYLEAAILENLRMYPPFSRHFRLTSSNVTLSNGMRLPKGVLVAIPVYAVQRNPEIFPDPDAFQPERFLKRPELASSPAFQAFGAGPRNCIGRRFAMAEMMVSMAKLINSFVIKEAPGGGTRLEPKTGSPFVFLVNELEVLFEPRT